ncbi:MAG: hypothetical protein KU28_00825 [Sulfurovum sp. PC08-66]|nr:MAG: hypothetical protein KU28_00825 [Sulfurovum sp. PC08-66]KIM12510.1 MAG: hypothetical protein KU37_00940 [Sulfuricurvum sp. PC08-66]
MTLDRACVTCILGQASRVASTIHASASLARAIDALALEHSQSFDFSLTPPEVATPLYEAIAQLAHKRDLYDEAKAKATQEAVQLLPMLRTMIQKAPNSLLASAKMAVAGNVIDLATQHEYDLLADVARVLEADFGVDDFASLFDRLQNAQTLLYLADNAGEHIFDLLFIEHLKGTFPTLAIHYMTRGNPIINDVTYEEALESGIAAYATVVNSGVPTPGFIYERASLDAQDLFARADVVIAKGMGNFETMTQSDAREVYHLFKVKCDVVAAYVGHAVGTYMALRRGLR